MSLAQKKMIVIENKQKKRVDAWSGIVENTGCENLVLNFLNSFISVASGKSQSYDDQAFKEHTPALPDK